jgi:GH18 family chitinase
MNKLSILCKAITLSLGCITTTALAASTSNFYVTYVSPDDVKELVKYGESRGIHDFFMWTVDQDTSINEPSSLISAVKSTATSGSRFTAYYANYAAYNDQRAIPGKSYLINDADLNEKLSKIDTLIYAFAETQVLTETQNDYTKTPHSFGAIYLFDPWSDLSSSDEFCGIHSATSNLPLDANGYNLICGYAFDTDQAHHTYDTTYNYFGNIEKFSELKKTHPNLTLSLSVGGFGHNQSFEAIFHPEAYGVSGISAQEARKNFIDSVIIVMNQYHLDSIDVDYENVRMTHEQSNDYYDLLKALNDALPEGKTITLPIITNPDYISGTEKDGDKKIGFDPSTQVLRKISALPKVQLIQLMTYDFSGTFNYGGDNRTGFLTNTYLPNNYPSARKEDYNFSVETAVQAMIDAGVSPSKISLGIPSYGRALSNLPTPSTTDATFLFSKIDENTVIPRGDQDRPDCDQTISTWSNENACQGMFSYRYIMNKMLPLHTVIPTDHRENSGNVPNGTTAFGIFATPETPHFSLTIINQNEASGSVDISDGASHFNTNGYVSKGPHVYTTDKNSAPRLSTIEGHDSLQASFTYWKQTISCQGTVTFDHDLTVTIDSSPVPGCTIR